MNELSYWYKTSNRSIKINIEKKKKKKDNHLAKKCFYILGK